MLDIRHVQDDAGVRRNPPEAKPETGRHSEARIRTWTQFKPPPHAAVIVDGGNFRVQIFDRNGRYLQSFGTAGKQLGTFARPKEVATDREGNVYVVDAAFGNFQIFNPEGELLLFVGDRSERDGPAKYMLPSGIAVDEDGRIYMVDQWFRKIEVYRPASLKLDAGFLRPRTSAR